MALNLTCSHVSHGALAGVPSRPNENARLLYQASEAMADMMAHVPKVNSKSTVCKF